MREMLKLIRSRLEAGEDLVLVTVIASSGATPRGAGARMLVGREGRLRGTIGGGAVEYRSEQIAAQVLAEKTSRGHDFTLTKDDVQNLGMICGGGTSPQVSRMMKTSCCCLSRLHSSVAKSHCISGSPPLRVSCCSG